MRGGENAKKKLYKNIFQKILFFFWKGGFMDPFWKSLFYGGWLSMVLQDLSFYFLTREHPFIFLQRFSSTNGFCRACVYEVAFVYEVESGGLTENVIYQMELYQ
jgi:hypothetical protein